MRERVMDVGLAVLGVLAVLLVVLAVTRQGGDSWQGAADDTTGADARESPAEDPPGAAPAPEPMETDTAAGEDTETDTGEEAVGATGRVADFRDGLLVHAGVADCDPERSVVVVARGDSGARRTRVEGLHSVTAVQVVDATRARVVGGGPQCGTVGFSTSDAGESWQPDAGALAFWGMRPGDPAGMSNGGGPVDVPCPAVGVSGVDPGVARALCDDGRILGTASAGVEWVELGRLDEALGVAFVTPAHGYGLAEGEDCAGVLVWETHDGGDSWRELLCAEGEGPWAIAAWDASLAVVGAGGRHVSTDAGDTWTRS